jgi:hypothetical protein
MFKVWYYMSKKVKNTLSAISPQSSLKSSTLNFIQNDYLILNCVWLKSSLNEYVQYRPVNFTLGADGPRSAPMALDGHLRHPNGPNGPQRPPTAPNGPQRPRRPPTAPTAPTVLLKKKRVKLMYQNFLFIFTI